LPDSDEEMFPWQFQLEADQRYTQFIESKKKHLQKKLAAQPDDSDLLVKLGRLNYYLIISHRVELIPETTAIFERDGGQPAIRCAAYHGSLPCGRAICRSEGRRARH
jgi:hypothetical protein